MPLSQAVTQAQKQGTAAVSATGASVPIHLNGVQHAVAQGETLAQLLEHQGIDATTVATALNSTFVPRSQRAQTVLQPQDSVTLFSPIAGG